VLFPAALLAVTQRPLSAYLCDESKKYYEQLQLIKTNFTANNILINNNIIAIKNKLSKLKSLLLNPKSYLETINQKLLFYKL
jgi:hypothetical protein